MAKGGPVRGLLSEGESSVALRDSLNRLLPGTNEDTLHFLVIADEEVRIYGELNKPYLDAKKNIPVRLRKIAETARAFAKSVKVLDIDPDAAERLQLEYLLSRRRDNYNDATADAQLSDAESDWKELRASAEAAGRTGAMIEEMLEREPSGKRRASRKGVPVDPAIISMTASLARAYNVIFHERPSAAAEGIFSRALHAIFSAAALKVTMGEKRLKPIVSRLANRGDPPKRGPKKRRRP